MTVRIGRDDKAVGADACDNAVLAFIVVDAFISHAVFDGLEVVSHDAARSRHLKTFLTKNLMPHTLLCEEIQVCELIQLLAKIATVW